MAELKTRQTDQSVKAFLDGITDDKRRRECLTVAKLMKETTGAEPKMWGDSIVGYGSYQYKYKSGREGEWFLTGFSPRKQNLTLYLMCDIAVYRELLDKLGKHKIGKSCLYIKTLEDIDTSVLTELIKRSVEYTKSKG